VGSGISEIKKAVMRKGHSSNLTNTANMFHKFRCESSEKTTRYVKKHDEINRHFHVGTWQQNGMN